MEEKKRVPKDVKGLCWGGFLISLIWGPFNGVWSSLLVLVPVVNIIMPFVLLFKGREWAWQNSHWESVEHFNKVQKRWTIAGLIPLILSVASVFYAIPNFKQYGAKAKRAEAKILLLQAYTDLHSAKIETGKFPVDWQPSKPTSNKSYYKTAIVKTDSRLESWCSDCQVEDNKFKIAAIGNIDTDNGVDIMTIDQDKVIEVLVDDLAN